VGSYQFDQGDEPSRAQEVIGLFEAADPKAFLGEEKP
jgi:hypothetical protein